MRRIGLVSLAMLFALTSAASGEGCVPTSSEPELAVAGYYFDKDPCEVDSVTIDPQGYLPIYHVWNQEVVTVESECGLPGLWWYEEANDIAGLQRGDEVVDDTCGGMINSDTLAFF